MGYKLNGLVEQRMAVSGQSLNFENLPLAEAAVRATLEAPLALSYVLVNGVHQELRSEFPDLQEPEHFERPPGLPGQYEFGHARLPGALYCGNALGIRIGIQRQVVVARWARHPLGEGKYPRFAALAAALWRAFDALSKLGATPKAAVVNMSYVNLLNLPHSVPVHAQYFAPDARIKLLEHAKQVQKVEASWRADADIDLRFLLEQVKLTVGGPDEVEAFRLTTAGGTLVAGRSAAECLCVVHDRLQLLFDELISIRAKKEWQSS